MKEKILTGWTIQRALFLSAGIIIIIQSVMDKQWFGIIPGGYFAAMGLFAFGCASGNCYGGTCYREKEPEAKIITTESDKKN